MKIFAILIISLLSTSFVFAKNCPQGVKLGLPKSSKVIECTLDEEWNGKIPLKDTYWVIFSIPVRNGENVCFLQKQEQRFIYGWAGGLKDVRTETMINPISCDAKLK